MADTVPMEDVWVQRIRAIGIAVALILSSVGGIFSAVQGWNNASRIDSMNNRVFQLQPK